MADGAKRIGRIALALAACVAAVAIGVRIGRTGPAPKPAPAATAPGAPANNEMAAIVPQLEARLRAKPDDPQGWRMLGFSYFGIGRYADAARAYARQTALAPNEAGGWSALGESLIFERQGRIDEAAGQALARALKIDPKDPRARFYLAERRYVAGDHKGAIDDWIALLNDAPPDATYAVPVRERIEQTAASDRIDIAGRLPAAPAPDAAPASGPNAAQLAAAAQLDPAQQRAMARGMVDRLAARLAADPRDEAGWVRLIGARGTLGDAAGARKAFDQAREAFGGDRAALARIEAAAKAAGVR